MQINPIVLPGWLTDKAVFQQGVKLRIEGTAASSATIMLEIVKDPTDGRRVSKLDTEYGVILSLETTTDMKGHFTFIIPEYKASTDAYTFIFKCLTDSVTLKDIRCGDCWIFLGSEFLSVPISESTTPNSPLKMDVLNKMRFFNPSRTGLEEGEEYLPFEPKTNFKDAHWIKVTDTKELAGISTAAFSFAYQLADQLHYPVGIVDLSCEESSITSWISKEVIDRNIDIADYLRNMHLYLGQAGYDDIISKTQKELEIETLKREIEDDRKHMDFDFSKVEKLKELEGVKETDSESESKDGSASSGLDFSMMETIRKKESLNEEKAKEKDEGRPGYVEPAYRMSLMYNSKLAPLKNLTIRGMCYSPNSSEHRFKRYDLMLMGLIETLASVFEPRSVMDDKLMPSFIFVAMHPKNINYDEPYRVLEFNEEATAFMKRLTMPSGMVSIHDLLLPDKTKTYYLGERMSVVALGIHFTPKMPTSCPECTAVERAGNKLILSFENLGDGLRLSEGESVLRGFAVCGADRVFHPAEARILHGVRVMVWNDEIDVPESVTYGFTPFPHSATFKNLNDLPVLPFRFDREPAYYAPDLFFTSCDKLEFVGKRERDKDFETLKVFRTFKGNGVITSDKLNKTEGSASLRIKYETENSLYGFEPVLSYDSLMPPIEIPGRKKICVDIFNPEQKHKMLRIDGFGEAEIRQQLTWQTLVLEYKGEGTITLDSLKFTIEDQDRYGEIYVDNIRFK